MFPWILFWAPQLHFPWSGSVAQRIDPDTNWFFDAIPPQAGNGRLERKAFERASYGRQLGLITEVLLALARTRDDLPEEAAESLRRLEAIRDEIEGIKSEDARNAAADIEAALRDMLKRKDPAARELRARLRELLED